MRAACSVRRRKDRSLVSTHAFLRGTPHAALCMFVTACTPTTTRPAFAPQPEALHAVINAPPERVVQFADSLLRADTIRVRFVSLRDAFLETAEFGGAPGAPGATPAPPQRVRLWADPDVPGKARVTIEAVYRPIEDPSRTTRDLERASPPGSPGQLRAQRLLTALKDKLGVTTY